MSTPVADTVIDTVIDLDKITNDGSDGSFDVLMAKVGSLVTAEATAGRIRGTDYANVFLGSLTATLAQAIQFTTTAPTSEANAELVIAQIQEVDQRSYNLEAERAVIDNRAVTEKANFLQGFQKLSSEQAQTRDLIDQYDTDGNFDSAKDLAGLLAASKNQAEKNVDVLQGQIDKLLQEAALLRRKRTTEEAQTTTTPNVYAADGTATVLTVSPTDGGVIGKENGLRAQQTAGFIRDSEQKAAKIMLDAYAVRINGGEDVSTAADAKLGNTEVGAAITQLLNGVS